MALYKRPGSPNWYMDFTLFDKRVHRSTKVSDKLEAKRIEDLERKKIVDGLYNPETKDISFSQAIESAYDQRWAGSADGEQVYRRLQECLAFTGDIMLSKLCEPDVLASLWKHLKSGSRRDYRSVATLNRYKAHVKTLLRMAQLDWMLDIRIPRISLEKEPKTRGIYYLTNDFKLDAMCEYLRTTTDVRPDNYYKDAADALELTYDTGLRPKELCSLTFTENVKFETSEIILYADQTKSGEARRVPLTQRAVSILKRRHTDKRIRVFPFTEQTLSRLYQTAKDGAGVSDETTLYSLRHTFATNLLNSGANLVEVKELMGHSNITVTERYAKATPSGLRGAINRLEAN